MKHADLFLVIVCVLVLALPFVGFWVGFSFGQRSVRLMPMRTETLQVSDRMTIQRVIPEPANPVAAPVTRETSEDDDPSVSIPPQYQGLLKQYRDRNGGGE